ncbi:hypothetical protein [Pseudophaeobacter sp.]|uniref:hypothetical protein n=1 Tax=Pseudophaeobacter sp. TaxID=1971739 RepID=UPI0032978AA3
MPPIKRALIFLTGSAVAQAAASLTGLLLARWLIIEDYAIYTIMIAITGAVTVLTRSGVHLGFSTLLGRSWPDLTRAGQILRAAVHLRRIVSMFMLPPVMAVTVYLLWENGAGSWLVLAMLGLLFLYWWADMRTQMLDQVLYFDKQTTKVQTLDTLLSIARACFVATLFLSGGLTVIWAVMASVGVAIARMVPIGIWVRRKLPQPPHELVPSDRETLRQTVMKEMPVTIFVVFQGQIVLLVLSLAATSAEVAGYGALTRITQLLVPVQAFVFAFAVPIFAKRKAHLGRTLTTLVGLCTAPGLFLVATALVFPAGLLWLVGPNYADLHTEIVLACIMAMLIRTAGALRGLVSHRGWLTYNWLSIPINLAWIAAAPFVFDLGTISGALMFQMGFSLGTITSALVDFAVARKRGL